KHYVSAGGLVFAMFVQRTGTLGSTAPTATNYFHHDHLGSMVAVSDENGAVIERMAFDPWGKRRFVNGTPDVLDSIVGFNTDRGYTMHEHLDEMGVIHMNGRIYDPLIGRFMSADPFIQDPSNLQSYNRYTYVSNNPLALTDPSGYFSFKSFFKAIITHHIAPTPKNLFNLVASQPGQKQVDNYIMTHKWAYAVGQAVATIYGGPAGAAAFSSYYTYQGTGSMTAAFKAGATTYATTYALSYVKGADWGIVPTVIANATVGGVSASLQGGSFKEGFKSAFVLSVVSEVYKYASKATDASKLKACETGAACMRNRWGELLTDGSRDVDYTENPLKEGNWFTKTGMAGEGSGQHLYSENSYLGRFVNAVSKLHDFQNSWSYSPDTGWYMSRGATFDTLFQAYSFAGMLPAAVGTGVALAADHPATYLYFSSKRRH
ncbi:RHS repeat domain-containing protein, partial [Polaromonas sp. A23]|uniref:RHS repeat domain-containing protein n=1 Tax=Polaromonas sp. A23 TaxID=1944133 RepID=UPI0009C44A4B